MKKILLLGGSRYILPVIEAIHRFGYWAITCDYLPDNIAHESRFIFPDFTIAGETLPQLMKEYEKYVIKSAVKEYKTSVNVAKKLGISQPTAARKIKEYIKDDI